MFCRLGFSGSEYCKVPLRSSDLLNTNGLAERVTTLTPERVYSIQINCFPVQNPKRTCLISCVKSLLIFVCWSAKSFVCVCLLVLWQWEVKCVYSRISMFILLSNYIFISRGTQPEITYRSFYFIFFPSQIALILVQLFQQYGRRCG